MFVKSNVYFTPIYSIIEDLLCLFHYNFDALYTRVVFLKCLFFLSRILVTNIRKQDIVVLFSRKITLEAPPKNADAVLTLHIRGKPRTCVLVVIPSHTLL